MPETFDFAHFAKALGGIPESGGGTVETGSFTPTQTSPLLSGLDKPIAGKIVTGSERGSPTVSVKVSSTHESSPIIGLTISKALRRWTFSSEERYGLLLLRYDECATAHLILYGRLDECVSTYYEFPKLEKKQEDEK